MRAWSVRGALVAAIAAVCAYVLAPVIAGAWLRHELATAGFPDAHLRVASVGLHHVRLTDVDLGDGLALGDVDVDAGATMLVGGRGPREVTIRGARVSTAGLARLAPRDDGGGGLSSGGALSVERLQIEDAELSTGYAPIRISATITLPVATQPLAVDAVARLARWPLGPVTAHDVVISVRGAGPRLHACATATIASAHLEACSEVPSSMAALRQLGVLDVAGSARDAGDGAAWTARGHGRIGWSDGGPVTLTGGHADVEVAARDGAVTTGTIAVTADASGLLSPLHLDVRGAARTPRVEVVDGSTRVRLRDVSLPFAVHGSAPEGGAQLLALEPLTMSAAAGELEQARLKLPLEAPALIIRAAGGTLALDAITHLQPLQIDGARVGVLGGTLTLDRIVFLRDHPIDVRVRARGLDLAQVVALADRAHVVATGALDGELVAHVDAHDAQVMRVALRARGPGTVRVIDPVWRGYAMASISNFAIQRRIAAALADLEYSRLTIVLGPPGADPDLRLAIHGRGRTVDQEIDLAINVRNARAAIGALP